MPHLHISGVGLGPELVSLVDSLVLQLANRLSTSIVKAKRKLPLGDALERFENPCIAMLLLSNFYRQVCVATLLLQRLVFYPIDFHYPFRAGHGGVVDLGKIKDCK